ncbi:MAG: tetratricopeptide repeat protein, partial [Planctomycetales bacterium]
LALGYNQTNFECGCSAESLRHFTTVSSSFYPELYDHYVKRGMAYYFNKDHTNKEATADFETALKHMPESSAARLFLGDLYTHAGRYSEAIAMLRKGLQHQRIKQHIPMALLAVLLAAAPEEKLRDGKEALRLAKDSLKGTPPRYTSLKSLAAAHGELGDFKQALAALERIKKSEKMFQDHEETVKEMEAEFVAGRPWRLKVDEESEE